MLRLTDDRRSGVAAETLCELARLASSIRHKNGFTPTHTSVFATQSLALPDGQSFWADRPIAFAVRAGSAYLMFAESHLRALAATFQSGTPEDPPVRASCRQILEAAAYAHWLLDPNLNERERAQRALAEAKYALVNRSKSIHEDFVDAGHNEIGDWTGQPLVDAIEQTNSRLKLSAVQPRPKAVVALDSILPSVTDRKQGALPAILQRLLSGGVHPDLFPWVNTELFGPGPTDSWKVPGIASGYDVQRRPRRGRIQHRLPRPRQWIRMGHPAMDLVGATSFEAVVGSRRPNSNWLRAVS
jgi:hypothetical protein